MNFSKEDILKALSQVIDPDLKKDLVSLNMIQDLEILSDEIRFKLVLTTPACPLKSYLHDACVQAIHNNISKDVKVNIEITSKVGLSRSTKPTEENLRGVKNIIAVVSGKGGVGKSTVAVNLAVGLSLEGASVGLLDGDIYGPSIPMMLGIEEEQPAVKEVEGRQIIEPIQKFGVKVVSIGLFVSPDKALVWRGPMASNYLKQLITDTNWGNLDYLIFDMPPGTGDMHLTLVQTVPVTGVVIVTTPQNVALADARKAISMFQNPSINVPILGIVENMSYFTPAELPEKKYYIFGKNGAKKLCEETGVSLLGQIPINETICSSGDEGTPILINGPEIIKNAYLDFCRKTAQAVSIRNANFNPAQKINVN